VRWQTSWPGDSTYGFECPEPGCEQAASISYTFTLPAAGPGPRGAESVIEFARVVCVAGHHLDVEVDDVVY
jgi:hypothetical protein